MEEEKSYVGVDKVRVSGGKEVCLVYTRLSKKSTAEEKEKAFEASLSVKREMGGEVFESVLVCGEESERFLSFLSGKEKVKKSGVRGKYRVVDAQTLQLQTLKGQVYVKEGKLFGMKEDSLLLLTFSDKEHLFLQSNDNPLELLQLYHTHSSKNEGALTLFTLFHPNQIPQEFLDHFSEENLDKQDESIPSNNHNGFLSNLFSLIPFNSCSCFSSLQHSFSFPQER